MPTPSEFHTLRAKFAGLVDSSYKQMGLRSIRNGLLLMGRNEVEVQRCMTNARYQLPYAEAHDARDAQIKGGR